RHLQEMLRLNPNDNQGVRYTLSGWLLGEDRNEDLVQLLEQYDEDSATWAYTKALVAFRRKGNTPEARALLKTARKANEHVPDYLLGLVPLPLHRPEAYSAGDRDEAILYAGIALSGWRSTPGAIAWLKQDGQEAKRRGPERPKAQGPLPQV